MFGFEMFIVCGILIKINLVMIFGINDEYLLEVNKWVKECGVFLYNVMLFIFDLVYGIYFGFIG